MAFKTTMMRMAAASRGSPTKNEIAAAMIRMTMRTLANCRRKTWRRVSRASSRRTFSP